MEDMSLQNMASIGVGLLAWLVFIVAFIVLIAIIWGPIYKKFASLKQEAEANKQGTSSTKRDNEESNLSEDPKIILDKSLPLKGKRQLETEKEKEFNEPAITLLTEKDPPDRKQEDKKEEGDKENINTEETNSS